MRIFLTSSIFLIFTLDPDQVPSTAHLRRSEGITMDARGRQQAGQSVAVVDPGQETRLAMSGDDTSPLLVLDAGTFLTRCRWCSWKSTRESTPGAAMAAFEMHVCRERLE